MDIHVLLNTHVTFGIHGSVTFPCLLPSPCSSSSLFCSLVTSSLFIESTGSWFCVCVESGFSSWCSVGISWTADPVAFCSCCFGVWSSSICFLLFSYNFDYKCSWTYSASLLASPCPYLGSRVPRAASACLRRAAFRLRPFRRPQALVASVLCWGSFWLTFSV